MRTRRQLLLGGVTIVAALATVMVTGVRQATVFFVTPSELLTDGPVDGRAYRLGGMVVSGSLQTHRETGVLEFQLTDGKAVIPVRHRGLAPDLFGEGRGAVVEGTYGQDGMFRATQILAKHSEEYRPPADGTHEARYRELIRSLNVRPAP